MENLKQVNTLDLMEELTNRGYFRYYWHEDDVKCMIQEYGHDYTDEDIREIKSMIQNNVDHGGPLTFELIENCISEYFNLINLKS
jgi:hypothetical protein